MRKTALTKRFKRLCALTGAFVIAVSVTSFGFPNQGGGGAPSAFLGAALSGESGFVPVPYTKRIYERYDPLVLEQVMADFEAACKTEGQQEQVARLYELLLKEYDRLSTLAYMAQIAYDKDISNPAAAEEQAYTTDLYVDMSEKMIQSIQRGLDSSYGSLLRGKMGAYQASMVEYYQPYTQEELGLVKEEDQLIRKYETLAAADTSVIVDGENWTYERLETDNSLTTETYGRIQEALSRERNGRLGGCLLELAHVRRRIAGLYGYDSYSDYVYEVRYGRDYTLKDAARLCETVKNELVPLYDQLWYADIDYSSYDQLDKLESCSTKEVLDAAEAGIGRVNGELGDVFRYMRENELYDIQAEEPGKDRVDTNYTVRLASYGDAYIFVNRENTFRDHQAVIHEFGHFSAYYYDRVPELYSSFGVDVMEIQSMGLELLVSNYGEEVAGAGGTAYAYETVNDMFFNVISACMFNEFEALLYENPGLGLDELNKKFKEIQDSYGGGYYQVYGGSCYDWVEVPHIFYDPMYYMGYGTASLTALDLWSLSQKDMDAAVNTYMGILKGGTETPYRETVEQWGLSDIFDEAQVKQLTRVIREHYGLGEPKIDEDPKDALSEDPYEKYDLGNEPVPSAPQEAVISMGIVVFVAMALAVIIALQLALLGMGGIIIWLLLKHRS